MTPTPTGAAGARRRQDEHLRDARTRQVRWRGDGGAGRPGGARPVSLLGTNPAVRDIAILAAYPFPAAAVHMVAGAALAGGDALHGYEESYGRLFG